MTHQFDSSVITAVLAHMNDDHTADNLVIAHAFGAPDATAVEMTGFDGDGSDWSVQTPDGHRELRISWPDGPIDERPAVRQQVVALYVAACKVMGVKPRRAEGPGPGTHEH